MNRSASVIVSALFAFWMNAAPSPIQAAVLPAIAPGTYRVGSSNLEIRSEFPSPLIDYLKGKGTSKSGTYLSDLLAHPESALVTSVELPADEKKFGRDAGRKLPLVLYVLYPTTEASDRADYKFPYPETADNVFPRMQRAGEKPLFAGDEPQYPLIVLSHGWEGHGLWDLDHLKFLAAHGYIVVSVFHGDGRMGFETGVSVRPLALKAALDHVLAHPDFGPAIDRERIGVTGGSMGGYTVLASMGGGDIVPADPRIKAGFGLVPFTGNSYGVFPFKLDVWPFGKDYAGLKRVKTPYLALFGEKDVNVVPEGVLASAKQVAGPTAVVELGGEQHLVSKSSWSDIFTWEVLFFDAWLKGDETARKAIYESDAVQGGVNDRKVYQQL